MNIADQKVRLFLHAIESTGINAEDAALAADLPPSMVNEWLEEGRKEEEHVANGGRARKRSMFALELWRAYRKARAKARGRLLELLQKHAKDDWRATAKAIDYLTTSDARTEREDPAYYMGTGQ